MTVIDFKNVFSTIMTFSLFATAVVLMFRKVGLIDYCRAKWGDVKMWPFSAKFCELLDCNFCLGFWIIVISWTILNILMEGFFWRGYLYAFCAAPLVEIFTTFLIFYSADYRDQPPDEG